MPGSAPEILSISKNLDILQSKNIYATISEYSIIQKTLDKKKIYETLDKKNIPIPAFFHVKTEKEFYSVIKKLGYPRRAICFKPSSYLQSGGARGFRILRSNNKIENIILHNKPGSIEIDFDTTKRLTKNNIITVVTSRKNKFLVLKILKKLHFKPFIDNVYCATDCKKNNFPIQNNIKLKKCLYQLAINDNSVQAKEKTIVIGNLTEDIIAAKNLKVIPVAVRGSYRYDFGISRLSDTIRELPEILKFL